MTTEADMRALARRFFDAVEQGDIAAVQASYADDAQIWHNTDQHVQTPAENAATLKGFVARISNRVYANRRLAVFAGGFVHQHELHGIRADGVAVRLPACIVCRVENGKITRLDEYFDSAHVAAFRQVV